MHPKLKNARANGRQAENGSRAQEKTKVFKGLALPDKEIPFEVDEEPATGKGAIETDAIDETFALLEGLGQSKAPESVRPSRKRSRSPDDEYEKRRSRKDRHRSRSRSADGDRRRRRKGQESAKKRR